MSPPIKILRNHHVAPLLIYSLSIMPARKTTPGNTSTQESNAGPASAQIHRHDDEEGEFSLEEHPHQHALFMLGDKHIFLVHQTNTWLLEHQYQMILRVTIPPEAKKIFQDARKKDPSNWHILGNKASNKFTLDEVKRGKRKSFMGAIWTGWPTTRPCEHWPWCNEKPLVDDVEVKIKDVVYFRRFDYHLTPPDNMTCILFGYEDEAHLQHFQVKPPTFDLVATLTKAPSWLPRPLLESGVYVSFPDIPQAPPCTIQPPPYHKINPMATGTHNVRFSTIKGGHMYRLLTVKNVVFFGNFPVNEEDAPTSN